MKHGLWLALPLLALGACATGGEDDAVSAGSAATRTAAAELRNASGAGVARASVEELEDSVRVRVEASGLPQGAYGVHVHTTGACDAPAFTTAGPHWNPTGQQHGKDNPQGMHKGDLPNLLVGADGTGSFEYTIAGASLSGGPNPMLDADGAAVVVHQSADDYRTDPSGNSGNRIACGVLG
ncbi:superoxide dismutase family protein [Sphingosinicella sp. BN140058]|nr:superoxide dismutase family protein [Sphingosinicella sp. BN140058]QAY79727.1 superoxide dismutase family protein [Sphingosinicella sp. BN140058]